MVLEPRGLPTESSQLSANSACLSERTGTTGINMETPSFKSDSDATPLVKPPQGKEVQWQLLTNEFR